MFCVFLLAYLWLLGAWNGEEVNLFPVVERKARDGKSHQSGILDTYVGRFKYRTEFYGPNKT